MYMDTVVFAGLATVALVCLFFGGLYLFIKKDMRDHQNQKR